MFCEKCGKSNDPGAKFCVGCGQPLAAVAVEVDDCHGGLIPKNKYAVWSYYLGIASLLCCAVTGIPALITGIIALKKAGENPELKGHVHAWIGIVLGAISVIVLILFAIAGFTA